MYGAIIGDIAGSKYEFASYKEKPATIMDDDCFFTDDTVMTVAIADAILHDNDFGVSMRVWGKRYPGRGYGSRFQMWLDSPVMEPYGSFGNGSAMRVSPVAWAYDSLHDVREAARQTAIPTHNHPEGVKGAMAVAEAIYEGIRGCSKEMIQCNMAVDYVYPVHMTCDEIRPKYYFDETCQRTVPQAIMAFVDSTDFEDAIKLAISLGGDADTLACIAGSIAEAYYGIPKPLIKRCRTFLPEEMLWVIDEFYERFVDEKSDERDKNPE